MKIFKLSGELLKEIESADLEGADLRGANLYGAEIIGFSFGRISGFITRGIVR